MPLPALFAGLDAEFGFTVDLAAKAENHKVARWLGPGSPIAESAFDYIPRPDDVCWCNPPYSKGLQPRFLSLAATYARLGVRTVVLVPARTDTRAFHSHVWDVERHQPHAWVREVRFLKGRLRFVGAEVSAPFPSMLIVFGV